MTTMRGLSRLVRRRAGLEVVARVEIQAAGYSRATGAICDLPLGGDSAWIDQNVFIPCRVLDAARDTFEQIEGLRLLMLVAPNRHPQATAPWYAVGFPNRRRSFIRPDEPSELEELEEQIRRYQQGVRAAVAKEWWQQQQENSLLPHDTDSGRLVVDSVTLNRQVVPILAVGQQIPLYIEGIGRGGEADPLGTYQAPNGLEIRVYVDLRPGESLAVGEGAVVTVTEFGGDWARAQLAEEIAAIDETVNEEIAEPLRGIPIECASREPVEPRQNWHHRAPDNGDGNGRKRRQSRSNGRRPAKRRSRH